MPYSIKLYIDITTSKLFSLSTRVLSILVMQSVYSTQFLNIAYLLLLSAVLVASSAPPTRVIVPLASIYGSLWSHKLDSSIQVLNLIWLLVLFVPRGSLFIPSQCFFLHLEVDLGILNNFLFFFRIYIYIYIYIIHNLSLGIFLPYSFSTVSELFVGKLCIPIRYFITN